MNNLARNIQAKSHMIKIRSQISLLVFLLVSIYGSSQNKYTIHLRGVDMDSATIVAKTGLQTSFASRFACEDYINRLPDYLQSKGFVNASIDSLS